MTQLFRVVVKLDGARREIPNAVETDIIQGSLLIRLPENHIVVYAPGEWLGFASEPADGTEDS